MNRALVEDSTPGQRVAQTGTSRVADVDPAEGGREPDAAPPASRRSRVGLDWFVFFVADVQTGFGPFVAVYLTSEKWTQTDIGLVLTAGSLVGLIGQIPAGALMDSLRSLRLAAAVAVVAIGAAAFALAAWPVFPVVLASRVVHAGASCVLGLALAYISLNLVGRGEISTRLGRNAAFASTGTALAAGGMGACGYFLSSRAVFFVTAALALPALVALFRIDSEEIAPRHLRTDAGAPGPVPGWTLGSYVQILGNRPLLIFAGCLILFQMANAAMLPLAASMVTLRSSEAASAMVAAAVLVPQLITALISPFVGRKAQIWGRRIFLVLGFSALPVRGLIFFLTGDPRILVTVQALDGISAAVLGVLVPLIISDVTRRSGHFNLAQGAVGFAVGIGASVSTTLVGYLADQFGSRTAFLAMTVVATFGVLVVALFMPETRPQDAEEPSAS